MELRTADTEQGAVADDPTWTELAVVALLLVEAVVIIVLLLVEPGNGLAYQIFSGLGFAGLGLIECFTGLLCFVVQLGWFSRRTGRVLLIAGPIHLVGSATWILAIALTAQV